MWKRVYETCNVEMRNVDRELGNGLKLGIEIFWVLLIGCVKYFGEDVYATYNCLCKILESGLGVEIGSEIEIVSDCIKYFGERNLNAFQRDV